ILQFSQPSLKYRRPDNLNHMSTIVHTRESLQGPAQQFEDNLWRTIEEQIISRLPVRVRQGALSKHSHCGAGYFFILCNRFKTQAKPESMCYFYHGRQRWVALRRECLIKSFAAHTCLTCNRTKV